MKAVIHYWYDDWSKQTGYQQGEIVLMEDINDAISTCFMAGLNVMLTHATIEGEDRMIIAVDHKRFQQR
jgi:hypothetical protein